MNSGHLGAFCFLTSMHTPGQPYISEHAEVDLTTLRIGYGSSIHDEADLDPYVTIGDNTVVGHRASIGGNTYIGSGVHIGVGVNIGHHALILDGAKICPDDVTTHSTDARYVKAWSGIGPGVLLHNEIELGEGAIVSMVPIMVHGTVSAVR
jgi:UDP-3-O-[3-hydroxymyristoyl] glucosamine N-acyltransferase